MPAALQVDKEQVRMLVLSIGVREAARKLGIAQGTVQAWSADGQWLAPTRAQPAKLPPPASQVGATIATKPADALASVLARHEQDTRICLSTATRRIARDAAKSASLSDAPDLQALARTYALVHRLDQQTGSGGVSTAIQINIG